MTLSGAVPARRERFKAMRTLFKLELVVAWNMFPSVSAARRNSS
jgi:hypothetical protein